MIEIYFPTFKKWYETPWLGMLLTSIKGLLPGRTTWKTILTDSELPVEVQGRIGAVVARTRLWRSEKLEVCSELISHFEDGHEGGAGHAELIERFGEPVVVAPLIARAKKRNRSFIFKSTQAAFGCSCGLVLCYGLFAGYIVMGSASPQTDYVQILNATAHDAKEENKAWPIYREAWIESGFCNNNEHYREIFDAVLLENLDGSPGRLIEPDDKEWPAVVKFVNEHQKMLDQFRAAGAKPSLGLELLPDTMKLADRDLLALLPNSFDADGNRKEYDDEEDRNKAFRDKLVLSIMLPHIQNLQRCTWFLKQDTQIAVAENDSERAIANMRAVFGIANQIGEYPVLVCSLSAFAADHVGFEQIEFAINRYPDVFSDSQLLEIQSLVAGVELRGLVNFEGERMMAYDCLQRCYTDDGSGNGRVTSRGYQAFRYFESMNNSVGHVQSATNDGGVMDTIGMPIKMFSLASREETRERYDEIIDAAEAAFELPDDEFHFDIEDYISREERFGRFRFLNMFCPKIEFVRTAWSKLVKRQDAIASKIESELLKRENGKQ